MVKRLASLTMVAVVGNSLAPVLGGFLAAGLGWRAVFATLVVTAATVATIAWRRLPETRPSGARPPRASEMLATAGALLRKPLFVGCLLQGAVVYSTFLVFISLAPYVMVSALGRAGTEFGFYYLFIAGGYFLGNWSVSRFMARHDLHWMVVVGVLLTAVGAAAAPQHAGVASSVIGFLQQLIGAAAVQAMGHFPTDTAMPMLVFVTGVCALGVAMLYVFPRVEAGRPR